MKTITRHIDIEEEYTLYTFDELPEKGKQKVRDWYIRDSYFRDTDIFSEDCNNYLAELFPNSDLKVEYSLNYCQGDGLNIYGDLDLMDIYEKIKGIFTEKEQKFFRWCLSEYSYNFKMNRNNRYCYCICDRWDYSEGIIDDMEYADLRNIRYDLLEKFSKECADYLCDLCSRFEQDGYSWFYEPTDEEISEDLSANDFEFLEDGTIF